MSEDIKAVETTENAAPQVGVEAQGTVAPQAPTNAEIDLAVELEAVRLERDNYRRMGLKAKGKLPQDEVDAMDSDMLDEVVSRKVAEALSNSRDAELEAREKALLDKVIKENKELKLATQNRAQINSGTGQGTSQEAPKSSDAYFSDEQLAELKRRGVDPEKVKANILKRH